MYTRIYKLYKSSKRVYIRVYIVIYRGIYRPHRSSNRVYIRVYITIYRGSNGVYIYIYITILEGRYLYKEITGAVKLNKEYIIKL